MTAFKYFPIVLLVGIIALYSTGNYSNEATASSVKSSGIVSIRSVGYGKSKKVALEDAELAAVRQVLFEGIAGSAQPLPLISDPESAKMEFGNYFSELFSKRYKSFIQSNNYSYSTGEKGNKKVNLALEVNVDALKHDLMINRVNVE
jgi:hypothetical protein